MTKTSLIALALGATFAGVAVAQTGAPAAPRTPRIAVIDMQAISSDSALGKSYASKLETLDKEITGEGTKKQAELTKRDAAIKALQDDLEKQASVLSPEAREKKDLEIKRLARERAAFLEDGQAELQRLRARAEKEAQDLNTEFQNKIKPVIEAVSKEKGIDILLTSQVALTVNREFDISKEVIAKVDAAEAAAPKTGAASPKPPAAPKPSPAAPQQ
jgi:Skp family chaperone for outer membrane proteins